MKTQLPVSRGFTLIELLTVIAIIGILAAILIPVVGAVRQSARTAQATSNLRQLHSAMLLYVGDNRNNLPSNGWRAQLVGYMASRSTGPEANAMRERMFYNPNQNPFPVLGVTSVGDLTHFCPPPWLDNVAAYRITDVRAPSRAIFLADGVANEARNWSAGTRLWNNWFGSNPRVADGGLPAGKTVNDPLESDDEAIVPGAQSKIAYRNRGKALVVRFDGAVTLHSRGELTYRDFVWAP